MFFKRKEWFNRKNLSADLSAGVLNGIIIIFISISLSTYICGNNLPGYVNTLFGIIVVSVMVVSTLYAIGGSLPNLACSPQDTPSIILLIVVTSLATSLANTSQDIFFNTLYAIMILMSLSTGIIIFAMGKLKLGNLTRFIPFPVIAGFLAGAGWLLFKGVWPILIGQPLSLGVIPQLFIPKILMHWLPVIFLGVCLTAVVRTVKNPLVVPLTLISALIIFYVVVALSPYTVSQVMANGLLLGPLPEGKLYHSPNFTVFLHADWKIILSQLSQFGLLWILVPIGILMNSASLEVITDHEMDYNRELKWGGIANFISPLLGGGLVSYGMVVGSALNQRLKAKHRIVGIVSALTCLTILLVGVKSLNYIPQFIYTGILLLLSFDLIIEWLFKPWFQLSLKDNLIILTIFSVIFFTSLLPGILVGLVIFLCLFVWEYSRLEVISGIYYGDELVHHSVFSKDKQAIVSTYGHDVLLIRLKGYLFFGNSYEAFNKIIKLLKTEQKAHKVQDLILDFSEVTGMDSSALLSFRRLKQFSNANDIAITYVNMTKILSHIGLKRIKKYGLMETESEVAEISIGLENALEHVIETHQEEISMMKDASTVKNLLELTEEEYESFVKYLEPMKVENNTIIIHQGEQSRDLYILEKGCLQFFLHGQRGDKEITKVHTGVIVGQIAYYTKSPRTVSVRSIGESIVLKLSESAFSELEEKLPHVAVKLHRCMATVVCKDLSHANRLVYMALQ